MLRISPQHSASAVRQYFTDALCRDDYYTQGTERPGLWHGVGAGLLEVDGQVERQAFSRLTDNLHPTLAQRLTPRTKQNRRIGYDLNSHVPKSVSVVHAITGDDDIVRVLLSAIRETMSEVERTMGVRVRRGGADYDRETGNMVWAEYLHFTTRPVDGVPDPHLHVHNFVFNCTYDKDEERWKAAQFGEIVRLQPYFQASFHSRLAAGLVELGYCIRRTRHAFEIDGVPQTVLDRFSRRTKQIETLAADLGFEDNHKATLGARTRERKRNDHSMDELHRLWSDRLTPGELAALTALKTTTADASHDESTSPEHTVESLQVEAHRERVAADVAHPEPDVEEQPHVTPTSSGGFLLSLSAAAAVKRAVATLFERESIVPEMKLRVSAMTLSHGKATPQQILDAIARRSELIRRVVDGRAYLTTVEAVREEQHLIAFAKKGRGTKRPLGVHPVSRSVRELDDRDKEVLHELMASKDRLTLFKHSGPTRKPELTRAAMTGIQEAGYALRVVAPDSATARQAEEDYGLKEVPTLGRLLSDEATQKELKTKVLRRVIWVEGAGRLGTRNVAALARLAERTGARLVLSGDEARSRRYDRGDPFRLLREEAGLSTAERRVMRAKEDDLERAADALVLQSGSSAVSTLDELGTLVVAPDDDGVLQRAVDFHEHHRVNGRKPLLVLPSAQQLGPLIKLLRERLREGHVLRGQERSVLQLRPMLWTEAMKKESKRYHRGMVIDFHRPTRGFTSGDRTRVLGVDSLGGVWVRGRIFNPVRLRLAHADRFTVSKAARAHLAIGDRIRVTRWTGSCIGRPVRANTVLTVKAFNPCGDIVVDGLRVLSRKLGHFEHDYATTTHRLSGRRADAVAFVAGSHHWAGAESKDIAAVAEAARKTFRVIVEDIEALANTIDHVRPEVTATDLTDRPERVELEFDNYDSWYERMRLERDRSRRYGT